MKLLEHFDRVSEAPGAVPRLRRFILDLAVRGKLLEQDLAEEAAAVLYERLRAGLEKISDTSRLEDGGRFRRGRHRSLTTGHFPVRGLSQRSTV